jgi:hypothetical protein
MLPDYYEKKVKLFIGLAPIVRLENTKNSLMKWASQDWILTLLKEIVPSLHLFNLFPNNRMSQFWNSEFCHMFPHICEKGNEGFYDFDDKIDNVDRIADMQSKDPYGAGWRNLVHYGQIISKQRF